MKILVLNCGSSSIKYQVIDGTTEVPEVTGLLECIGEKQAHMRHRDAKRQLIEDCHAPDHVHAMDIIHRVLETSPSGLDINAVGHRVVHGAELFITSVRIDAEVEAAIEKCSELAPLHNPPNLTGIRAAKKLFPDVEHVAVFDTAFHESMPPEAWCYALPWELYKKHGIRRYGFHGTSHHYVMLRASQLMGIRPDEFTGITLHLGNGCSATAIQNGRSVDTSMGLTPLEGLVMGTRCGDIDPAIPFFMADKEDLSFKELDDMLNKQSGLKGISGLSNDVRTLEAAALEGHERADLALRVYARRIRKYIGAYLAMIVRPRAIVFTGGVGEHDAFMRYRSVVNLEHLGICLDADANRDLHLEGDISTPASPLRILVVPTREELMIARETMALLRLG
jgi:acetate kinase